MYPLFAEAFGYKATVGAPFFNLTFVPIMTPLVALMPLGPLLSWKRADLAGVLGRLKFAFVAAAAAALLAVYLQGGPVLSAALQDHKVDLVNALNIHKP